MTDEVLEDETCDGTDHVWPRDAVEGDVCNCGKMYLFFLQGQDAEEAKRLLASRENGRLGGRPRKEGVQ